MSWLLLIFGGVVIAALVWVFFAAAEGQEAAREARMEASPPPAVEIPEDPDTEERYREHLAALISRTRSRGGTRYFNQYVNRCRAEAAAAYPKGAAAAQRKDMGTGGVLAALAVIFSLFG